MRAALAPAPARSGAPWPGVPEKKNRRASRACALHACEGTVVPAACARCCGRYTRAWSAVLASRGWAAALVPSHPSRTPRRAAVPREEGKKTAGFSPLPSQTCSHAPCPLLPLHHSIPVLRQVLRPGGRRRPRLPAPRHGHRHPAVRRDDEARARRRGGGARERGACAWRERERERRSILIIPSPTLTLSIPSQQPPHPAAGPPGRPGRGRVRRVPAQRQGEDDLIRRHPGRD